MEVGIRKGQGRKRGMNMADIELVIKIPENLYKATKNGLDANEIWDLRVAVTNGTPLPKGHWITTRTFMHDGEYYCDKCKCDSTNNEKWDYCPNCGIQVNKVNTPIDDSNGYWNISCRGMVCKCSCCGSTFDNTCNDILTEWHFCPKCGKNMF